MQRLTTRVIAFVGLFALLVAMLPAGLALAAAQTMRSDEGETDGTSFPNDHSFGHIPIQVGDIQQRYVFQTNHWNPASNGPMVVSLDDADPNAAFTVSTFTENRPLGPGTALDFATSASVYDGVTNTFSPLEGESDQNSGRFHAPANYPDVFKGCHWGSCSTGLPAPFPGDPNPLAVPARVAAGGPFPIQVSKLTSLRSTWRINLGENSGAAAPATAWNASFDIWFDMNRRGYLPGAPQGLVTENTDGGGQNDGAEIMIWLNNRGYAAPNGAPITPIGTRIAQNVQIPGAPDRYDVWAGRAGNAASATAIKWNVVSFVRVAADSSGTNPNATAMDDVDVMEFIKYTRDSTTMSGRCAATDPPANDPYVDPQGNCLRDNWWLTSVQAGFEIWAGGQGLGTTLFSVLPKTTERVATGRVDNLGNPLIHWQVPFAVRGEAPCATAVMTYDLTPNTAAGGTGTARMAQPMTKVQINSLSTPAASTPSDHFALVAPTFNAADVNSSLHGPVNVTFHVTGCSPNPADTTVPIFIDPSGRVLTPAGKPVQGATVTLLRSTSAGGPFTPVPNNNAGLPPPGVMSPRNTTNPDLSGPQGAYGWDVIPGFYRVRAEKAGCGPAVESPTLTIPPPVTNLNLILNCPFERTGQPSGPGQGGPGGGSNLPTQVVKYNDWGTGYCAYFTVTNNTSTPKNWTTTFAMPRAGTIYNKWNFNYTRSGNQLTAQGDAAWNITLQPGQSLLPYNHGFCVNTP